MQRYSKTDCQTREPHKMDEDLQLVKDCLKNNRASQKQLYKRFAEVMLGVCYRYTKSLADAEDVLQEGFIRVFNNLHQYRFEGELGAWIRRIMVTTALNYLKRNAKYQSGLAFDKIDKHPVTDDNPEIKLNTKDLASLIQQLPTGYQTIFNLHAVEGYTHVEIGELLGISDGTSRSQYARARAFLITWIKKYYSDNKLQSYAK
jgi:RNA polymerase sigma factor (sigma-70 family)